MALSSDARYRLIIATTSNDIGTEVADAIDHTMPQGATITVHAVAVSASHRGTNPAKQPVPVVYGAVLGDIYTVNNDEGYQVHKIPSRYVGNLKFHVHWTKSSDVNEVNKNVRWEVSYNSVNDGEDLNAAPTVLTVEDTYLDSGTTTKIQYSTTSMDIPGAVAGDYLFLKIRAVTPSSNALSQPPVLLSLDITYTLYVGEV
jgi:hypothetical protein